MKNEIIQLANRFCELLEQCADPDAGADQEIGGDGMIFVSDMDSLEKIVSGLIRNKYIVTVTPIQKRYPEIGVSMFKIDFEEVNYDARKESSSH